MIIFTGIGAREGVPSEILEMFFTLGQIFAKKGFILRSGGAHGCDECWEKSYIYAGSTKKEIYLPYKNFMKNKSPFYTICDEAYQEAAKYHPNWGNLNQASKDFMGRNAYQILGKDLKTPTDFVVCYTRDGQASGGTGQAIRHSEALNIPVFNFHDKNNLDKLKTFVINLEKSKK